MKRVYREEEEDDFASEFNSAYSKMHQCLLEEHPHIDALNWGFLRAYLSRPSPNYTVTAAFSAYDKERKSIVHIHCSVKCKKGSDELEAICGPLTEVEYDVIKREYVPIKTS